MKRSEQASEPDFCNCLLSNGLREYQAQWV